MLCPISREFPSRDAPERGRPRVCRFADSAAAAGGRAVRRIRLGGRTEGRVAREVVDLVDAPPDVDRLDRPHPRRTFAGGVRDPARPADLLEVGVIAGGIALHCFDAFRRRALRVGELQQLLDRVLVLDRGPVDVRVEVRELHPPLGFVLEDPFRAEERRAFAVDRQERFGEQTDSVLRLCVADPESDVGKVCAGDVRDAARGPRQRHAVLRRGGSREAHPGRNHREHREQAAPHNPPPADAVLVRAEARNPYPSGVASVSFPPPP